MKGIKTALFLSILLTFGLISCEKGNQTSEDLPPGKLGIQTTDTLTVVAETMPGDTFISKNLLNNYLGLINDPIFGKTRSSIFSQFLLTTETVSFIDATTDSVILYLPYKGSYGDLSIPQRVKVYQLTTDLPSSPAYSDFSETGKIDMTNILADHTFLPRPNDSIAVLGSKTVALRIPLDAPIMGSKFIAGNTTDLSQSGWVNYFKGLFIQSVDQNLTTLAGSALNFDLDAARIVFYYKKNGDTKNYTFTSNGGIHINQVIQDRTNSLAGSAIGYPNRDTLFVLGQGGEKIKITFPYLNELHKLSLRGRITINKAELKFEQIPSGRTGFADSKQISAYAWESDNTAGDFISDASNTSTSFTLLVTKHIQGALAGTEEKSLILRPTDASGTARTMISGKNNIKLVVTLTKL